jgi:peptidoglycan/xylan/chitin deacetylase (PgdA/CDA1 family)
VSGRSRSLVICYHALSERWQHALALPAATLERQVRLLLRRGYRPGTAAEALEGRGRLFHVTFDDAFRSIELGLPALERLGVPVTVFACSGYADEGRALDVPELAADAARLPDELATMDWDALRGLAERGVEIGSHTVSHPHLPLLSDGELDRELGESKTRIEDELGKPCPLLAYPFGDEDGRVRAAARRAAYDAAFALPGRPGPFDRYAVARVGIYRRDSLARMATKTSALRRPAARLRELRAR